MGRDRSAAAAEISESNGERGVAFMTPRGRQVSSNRREASSRGPLRNADADELSTL